LFSIYKLCPEVGLNFEPVNLMKAQVVTAEVPKTTEQFVPAVYQSLVFITVYMLLIKIKIGKVFLV